jgi:hypothetical protein
MAKTISLADLYDLLTQCSVIELEGQYLEPQMYELTGEQENEFLCLSWTEVVEGEEILIMLTFNEKDNQKAKLIGNTLILISAEDKAKEELTLYTKLFNDSK